MTTPTQTPAQQDTHAHLSITRWQLDDGRRHLGFNFNHGCKSTIFFFTYLCALRCSGVIQTLVQALHLLPVRLRYGSSHECLYALAFASLVWTSLNSGSGLNLHPRIEWNITWFIEYNMYQEPHYSIFLLKTISTEALVPKVANSRSFLANN